MNFVNLFELPCHNILPWELYFAHTFVVVVTLIFMSDVLIKLVLF